jgi:dolichol-phosphate mannosyltransferase
MTRSPPLISIVAPVFNEENNVEPLVSRVVAAMRPLGCPFEIILVDDGSTDASWARIVAMAEQVDEVIGCRLSRSFGHQGALLAGLHRASGQAVVSMDGDLQHPPECIPDLIEAWRSGSQIVLTKRLDTAKTSKFKRMTSACFYKLFSIVSESEIEEGTSDFRLMGRQSLDQLLRFHYGRPFLRGAVQVLGFAKTTVPYTLGDRHSGTSKYTLRKMLGLARAGLISHSAVPLRAGIYLGLITGLLGVAELTYVLIQKLLGGTVPGWASILGVLSLLFSILFLIVGIIGLYIEDIHRLLKQNPHFIVAQEVGRDRSGGP